MKWIRFVAPGVLVVGLVLGLWAFWLEPASLTTREYRLSIPHWDSRLSGLRIAVLADLHVGSPYNGLSKLARVVEATNASRPDLILITGDLVIQEVAGGKFVGPEASAQVLKGLHAPLGVFVVLGNHDWWLDPQRVSAALEHVGIKDLEDDAARIRRGDAVFWLVGISDLLAGPHNFSAAMSRVTDDAPIVLFTHNPDLFPRITGRFSLMITGHTHGGQVDLPLVGRLVVPSRYGQRFAIGHIVENQRHLFVSSGIGTSIFPVRFRVPPEVTLLVLYEESIQESNQPN
jgi:predicted MPP superfamily phosphohydrolase